MKAKRNSTKSKKRETDAIHHFSQRDPKIVLHSVQSLRYHTFARMEKDP